MSLILVCSLPCILGFNALDWVQPMGKGSCILDFEDFLVSSNLLPLGSLGYVLFCTRNNGWGWDNFIAEANHGEGMKLSAKLRWYISYVIPVVIIFIYLKGYYDLFSPKGNTVFFSMLAFAICLLSFVVYAALPRGSAKQ